MTSSLSLIPWIEIIKLKLNETTILIWFLINMVRFLNGSIWLSTDSETSTALGSPTHMMLFRNWLSSVYHSVIVLLLLSGWTSKSWIFTLSISFPLCSALSFAYFKEWVNLSTNTYKNDKKTIRVENFWMNYYFAFSFNNHRIIIKKRFSIFKAGAAIEQF